MSESDTPVPEGEAAEAEVADVAQAAEAEMKLDEFAAGEGALPESVAEDKTAGDLAPVFEVPVNISAVLGRASVSVAQLLQLSQGSVLELDRKVGEAIDIYVNNRLVARGEVVIVDERLGVTMTEIIKDGDAAA
jgi:flagellar motor switch protein FliN